MIKYNDQERSRPALAEESFRPAVQNGPNLAEGTHTLSDSDSPHRHQHISGCSQWGSLNGLSSSSQLTIISFSPSTPFNILAFFS